jgi:hypothetical protein
MTAADPATLGSVALKPRSTAPDRLPYAAAAPRGLATTDCVVPGTPLQEAGGAPIFLLSKGPGGPIQSRFVFGVRGERSVGTKKTGKGRRKIGRKKRRMRARIRHRKK